MTGARCPPVRRRSCRSKPPTRRRRFGGVRQQATPGKHPTVEAASPPTTVLQHGRIVTPAVLGLAPRYFGRAGNSSAGAGDLHRVGRWRRQARPNQVGLRVQAAIVLAAAGIHCGRRVVATAAAGDDVAQFGTEPARWTPT